MDLTRAFLGPGEKRLANVLAGWVPGGRDVINGTGVTWPERDSEAAAADAVVTLDGTVPRAKPSAHLPRMMPGMSLVLAG